jgi:GDP-4-dehydro-6-deoxy-D-mannose reductase
MQNVLLIGGTGFVGEHMQRILIPKFNVVATGRNYDIKDEDGIRNLVKSTAPDFVINFASITTVRESFDNPLDTYNVGFIGSLNLLSALKEYNFTGIMLNISSSEVYGFPTNDQLPIIEESVIRPMSPYSVSKVSTEALCYQWSQNSQFEIVTARPFTHIGPGQSDRFAISNFAKQIAEILLGKIEPVIYVGDLDKTRDFTDVRDVVAAYNLLLEYGQNGHVYNVCSGTETSTRSLLSKLIEYSGVDIVIDQDKSLIRSNEQQRIYGNYKKISLETGWKPRISLNVTLDNLLTYWVEKLK